MSEQYYKENPKVDEQRLNYMKSCMEEMNSWWSKQYEFCRSQLEFASGAQEDNEIFDERKAQKRPVMTMNMMRPFINDVVNPLRLNPIGILVEHPDEEISDDLSGIIQAVEDDGEAKEAYEVALENAVICGIGWIVLRNEFKNGKSGKQRICFDTINDPLTCYIDPFSESVTGKDARYGMQLRWIDKKFADSKYKLSEGGVCPVDIYTGWADNLPDSVADLVFYERIEVLESKDEEDYKEDEEPKEIDLTKKPMKKEKEEPELVFKVRASRWIGSKLVSETILEMDYIPLIPVYGDRVYLPKAGIRWVGRTYWQKPFQDMINLYASYEAESVGLTPIRSFVMAEGQVEGYEEEWVNAHKESGLKVYRETSLNGTTLPPPSSMDNTINNQSMLVGRDSSSQGMQQAIGANLSAMTGGGVGLESGKAVLLKQLKGDISNAQYIDNLSKSVAQTGKVLLQMMACIFDVPQVHAVMAEDGKIEFKEIDLSEILDSDDMDSIRISVSSGPAYESRKREELNAIISIGQLVPEQMAMMSDELVRAMDSPFSRKLADRLHKLLPEQLQDQPKDAQVDPKALEVMAQMQQVDAQKDQVIQYLEQEMQRMQNELLVLQEGARVSLAQTQMNNETKLQIAVMQEEQESQRQAQKLAQDAQQYQTDMVTSLVKDIDKDRKEARNQPLNNAPMDLPLSIIDKMNQ